MIKHGVPPYLECSSRGDKRFSAFYVRPSSLKGKSIEQAYQEMKKFNSLDPPGSWREAKGRQALNMEECQRAYIKWWEEYVEENNLLPVLRAASGLSDMFGQPGHMCQATVLWNIRNA